MKAALQDPEEAAQSHLAADLEFSPFSHPDGPAQGPGGFMHRVEEISAQFETYDVRPDRLEQVGELVVADLRREARSKRLPAIISDRFSQVFALRDGKVVRIDSSHLPRGPRSRSAAGVGDGERAGRAAALRALGNVVHGQLDDVASELTDPNIVWYVSRRTFAPGVFHGHQGLRDLAARLAELWGSGGVEPAEFIATGDEVVVPVRLHSVSRSQGNTVTANAAHV